MFLFFQIPALTRTVLISLIALLTLLGIMIRPYKVSEAIIALAGAGLLLVLGLLSPGVALATLLRDWNTFFFFLGIMSLSTLAEAAGLFDWLAVQAARLSGNSSRRLFFNTFLLGSLISMLLSNDATALILTPIVYSLVTRLRLPVLPYLFACTFIADTASFLLPVSNPINILVTSQFPLGLLTFLHLLFLPSLLVIGINTGVFYLLYRRQLQGHFDIKRLPVLQETVKHQAYFRYTCVILNSGSNSLYHCGGDPIPTLPGCTWRSDLPFVWGTLLEADLPLEYSQADFLAYIWVHRGNVSGGPGARIYRIDRAIWSAVASTLWRNHLWGSHGRDVRVGLGDKSH